MCVNPFSVYSNSRIMLRMNTLPASCESEAPLATTLGTQLAPLSTSNIVDLRAQTISTVEAIEKRLLELEMREEHYSALEARMAVNASRCAERVRLNVGGRMFETMRSHLLRAEGSFFHAMLASGQWTPDEQGAYFLDMNPAYFDNILDFLRDGDICTDDLSKTGLARLRELFDYFLLPCPDSLSSTTNNPNSSNKPAIKNVSLSTTRRYAAGYRPGRSYEPTTAATSTSNN